MRMELISTHAPRMGSDVELSHDLAVDLFQPTLPVWGATTFASPPVSCGLFQPTLPVWGATPVLLTILIEHPISTHAPRMGSDQGSPLAIRALVISTHAPRMGSDVQRRSPSSRGKYFNPRSPYGERQQI